MTTQSRKTSRSRTEKAERVVENTEKEINELREARRKKATESNESNETELGVKTVTGQVADIRTDTDEHGEINTVSVDVDLSPDAEKDRISFEFDWPDTPEEADIKDNVISFMRNTGSSNTLGSSLGAEVHLTEFGNNYKLHNPPDTLLHKTLSKFLTSLFDSRLVTYDEDREKPTPEKTSFYTLVTLLPFWPTDSEAIWLLFSGVQFAGGSDWDYYLSSYSGRCSLHRERWSSVKTKHMASQLITKYRLWRKDIDRLNLRE